jgi:Xaa-Pro aminopeptidase
MRQTELSNIRLGPAGLVPRDGVAVSDSQDVVTVLSHAILDRGIATRRVGVEMEALPFTVGHYTRLSVSFPNARFVDATGVVESLRRIK